MATTIISRESKLATGINVFETTAANQPPLIETLNAINREILTHKYPMNVSANFHRATDAPIVINYNQYTDRASGQFLRTQPNTLPLLERTHELSEKHEIRWYEVADVVAVSGPANEIEVVAGRGDLAVVGILTVEAAKQAELLALLKRYGETLKDAKVAGFKGIASHRGYKGEHVASYEQWGSADAYRQAMNAGPAGALLQELRAMTQGVALHPYEVLSTTHFDP